MSYRRKYKEFDEALMKLVDDIIGLSYIERAQHFNWYYRDYLYQDIRYVAVIYDPPVGAYWRHNLPFDGEAHLEIEEMLRADDGECSLLEMVQKIVLRTHILLTLRFVHLARKARSYYYRDEYSPD
ncbi:Hypothetical predicted protein [Paramuricea clavata]|uniref:Uncharacterized protein n=1 Tax=Paramuricea clavata TaxID=317549 RepID=A0A7D9I0Y4_PARCT|nr:Hypothetical predicted protein [Paramuricea clavata]